ncbi:hypothetical protein ACLQ2Q_14765 [Microbacterium sp. DT81.1]|uniref:hypothetical protein n=1 Tax=Microbacterium sp. DT81.1 TaxID=3393413 RepID=UPI003CFBC133
MTLSALRDDALTTTDDGFAVRLGLPWIRSLPIASLLEPELTIDGARVDPLTIELGDRAIEPAALARETGWWFLQDRIVLRADRALDAGAHDVAVSFRLAVPYLQTGPDGPLTLPFRIERPLVLDAAAFSSTVSRDVA